MAADIIHNVHIRKCNIFRKFEDKFIRCVGKKKKRRTMGKCGSKGGNGAVNDSLPFQFDCYSVFQCHHSGCSNVTDSIICSQT